MADIIDIKARTDLRHQVAQDLGHPVRRTHNTWVWACPFHSEKTIGGFHVYKTRYKCYSCDAQGDIFDWRQHYHKETFSQAVSALGGEYKSDNPIEKLMRDQARAEQALKDLALEIKRNAEAIHELRETMLWEKYHEQLDEQTRKLWRSRGIPDDLQNYWCLGYSPDKRIWIGEKEYHTPSLTIPIWEPANGSVVNIKHRLLNPPDPNDKYRPERAGLPQAIFTSALDMPIANRTLLTEGEIKAMVSFMAAEDPTLQVVGLPGKTPKQELVQQLDKCDPLYICMDPDATDKAVTIATQLGKERCRLITLPEKIDDMILKYGLGAGWMRNIMRTAQRIH
jgi:hypothetical protein